MKPVVLTAGPFELPLVGEAVSQLIEQSWNVRFSLFAGIAQGKLVGSQGTPIYFLIADRMPTFEGESFDTPKIEFKFKEDKK